MVEKYIKYRRMIKINNKKDLLNIKVKLHTINLIKEIDLFIIELKAI